MQSIYQYDNHLVKASTRVLLVTDKYDWIYTFLADMIARNFRGENNFK